MTLAADRFASVRFSTGGLPPRERLTAYREMLSRSVGNFEVEAIEDAFDFSANAFALPGLGVAQIASSALRVERPSGVPVEDARDLILAVMHDGTASFTQRGREVTVEGGGAFLSSSHDSLVMQRTAARLTNYSLLRSELAPAVSNFDRALVTPLNPETIRLLTGYTALLFREGALASAGVPPARRQPYSRSHRAGDRSDAGRRRDRESARPARGPPRRPLRPRQAPHRAAVRRSRPDIRRDGAPAQGLPAPSATDFRRARRNPDDARLG